MKSGKIIAAAALGLAFCANAGTYTWTGAANDGLWFTAGNWNYDGEAAAISPGAAPSDDVEITNGETVTYVPGGDFSPSGTVTISGGSSLVQNGNAWPNITGTLVLDGGKYDSGTADTFRIPTGGKVTIKDGGELVFAGAVTAERIPDASSLDLQGGKLTLSEGKEFQPPNGFENNGTEIICWCYAPLENVVATFNSGSMVLTRTEFNGFYQNAGVYINIPAGSTATFTMPVAAASVYSSYFASGKFRYNGEAVASEADFNELFSVTEVDETHSTFALAATAGTYLFSKPQSAGVTGAGATVSATLRSVGDGEGKVVVAWATTEEGIDWTKAEELGAAEAGKSYSKAITVTTADATYYFAFGVVVDDAVAAKSSVASFYATDYTAIFTGEVSADWNTAGNWKSGAVPTTSDTIVIPPGKTCEYSGDISFADYNITINGGTFKASNEIRTSGRSIRNGTLSAVVYTYVNAPIEVRGSSIIATTTGRWTAVPRGFYLDYSFLNFHSGAACSYTYYYDPEGDAPTESDEFAALFTAGKILVDGAVLTDAERVVFTIDTENKTVTATLKETEVAASFEAASSAVVSGLSAALTVGIEVSDNRALYLLSGTDPANLAEKQVVAQTEDGKTYSIPLEGTEGSVVYWQFRLGAGEGAIYDSASPQSYFATAAGNVWKGSASALASDPNNWAKGTVPGADDLVYLVADLASQDMTWDLTKTTVASWKQIGNVVVTFQNTADDALTITGDAEILGGTWTHTGPADEPTTMVNVKVGGNMTIASGASVQAGTGAVNAANYRSRGYTTAHGAGFNRNAGGSFAGDGGHIPSVTAFTSYGSILDPMSYGSGGYGDNANYSGGGIVKLEVAGTLTVDGAVQSRGFGYPINDDNIGGAGSGGSVNITAGALAGAGRIDANGGSNGLYGPGSGGRVKIALTKSGSTFTDFTGTIEAVGGGMENADGAAAHDVSPAAAGTVALVGADGSAAVNVYNVFRYGGADAEWRVATDASAVASATHLPATDGAASEIKSTDWTLSGRGCIRVTKDARVASLTVTDADGTQTVDLNGKTLSVSSLKVGATKVKSGTYTAAQLNAAVGDGAAVFKGDGSVVVGANRGLAVILR